jgi:biotin carboxylase
MGAMSDLAGHRLLVVGGGAEAVPGLLRLRALGARLAVSDRDPHAPGFAIAEERLVASTYDADATVAAASALDVRWPVDGVLCIASDVPFTVARVARALDLPGLALDAARRAADKLAMKKALASRGVAVPEFLPITSLASLRRGLDELGPIAVLKPVDGRGARGVLRITAATDLAWAHATALAASPSRRLMLERFLAGPQISSESFVAAGAIATPGLADRNYEWLERTAPYVIEDGGLQPSLRADAIAADVDAVMLRAARAMGIESGVLKGDLVLDPQRGPVVIEVAARLSGGSFCTRTIPLSTGVDLVAAVARHAVGLAVDLDALRPRTWRHVANRYFLPPPGRIERIDGVEAVSHMPGVVHVELGLHAGDVVRPLVDHTCRAGSVIATGGTGSEAVARAAAAVAAVHFTITSEGETDADLSRHRVAG